GLTVYDISQVYARGFQPVLDAPQAQLDWAIDQAIRDVQAFAAHQGASKLQALRMSEVGLTLAQEVAIVSQNMDKAAAEQFHYHQLQAGLADLADYLAASPYQ